MNNNGKQTKRVAVDVHSTRMDYPVMWRLLSYCSLREVGCFVLFVNKEKEMGLGKEMTIDALAGILFSGIVFVVLMNAGEIISRLVLSLI